MTFRQLVASLLFAGLALKGAHAAQPDAFRITGHIDARIAKLAQEALERGVRTIRITSGGGDTLPALALARDIRKHHAALTVEGICGGACANYLFLAATKRTVRPGAAGDLLRHRQREAGDGAAAKAATLNRDYAPAARQEIALAAEAHVNQALLLEPMLRLHPSCYALTSHDTAGRSYVNYRSDFVGWTPSRAYLARAGVRVGGFWPANKAQFQAAFRRAFPNGANGKIAEFGPGHPSNLAALKKRLKAVPQCNPRTGRR